MDEPRSGRPRANFTLYKRRLKHGVAWYWRRTTDHGRTPGQPVRDEHGRYIKSVTDARNRVEDLLAGKVTPAAPVAEPVSSAPTFKQYSAQWWLPGCPYLERQAARGKRLSESYRQTQRGFLELHIWPELGDIPVDRITPGDVEDFLLKLRTKESRYKTAMTATSVNHVYGCLRKIFREGVRRRELRFDPTEGVDPLAENRRIRGVLTLEEIAKLFAGDALDKVWRGAVLHYALNMALCVTGCRLGELQGLQRQHVHVDGSPAWLDVVHGWRRAEGLAAPKAKSFRQVLIPAKPALTLRTILADSPYQDPEDLVFWGVSGRRPLGQRAILDVYREALEAIGIPRQEQAGRVLVPHSWRHGFTTGQRARGLPDAKLGKLTGHRTPRMVEHYGSHFEATDPDFKDAAEAAGRWLEGKA